MGQVVTEKVLSRGELRRQAMLDAATELFLEKGYERTSLSDIVSRSKGSRSTLYEQFGNKEGLLRAMIEDVTGDLWALVYGDGEQDEFTEEALVDLGYRFAVSALSERSVSVYRILAMEGPRMPEIAHFFFVRGPLEVERLLATRFRKTLGPDSPAEQLAHVFLGSILGVLHAYRVLGAPTPPWAVDLKLYVRQVVRVFLDGVGRSVAAE